MSSDNRAKRYRVLFIGPVPPPFSGPEMGMKLFLESDVLQRRYVIRHQPTNVRKSNKNKGRMDLTMATAFFRFFAALLVNLVRFRPHLVYYPITATQIGWLGRDVWCIFLCRLFGAKVVIHLRASHFRLNYNDFVGPAKFLVRFACGRVQACIVQANYLFAQFSGLVPESKMACIYQAIDTTEYENPDLLDYTAGSVLFMGHLTQAKGYCDLLRAIPKIVERCPQAKIQVAGTMRRGERNVLYNQLTGERLEYQDPFVCESKLLETVGSDNYENLGVVFDEQKLQTLRACDLFVLPSYSEGFSRAVVEALSVGKPIVFTPVGAHREVFSDKHGRCVNPGNVDELVDGICQLLEDRGLRNQIAEENYRQVRERFDIEPIAGQLSELFDRVIQPNASEPLHADAGPVRVSNATKQAPPADTTDFVN